METKKVEHIKIYGTGVSDVLRQAEIESQFTNGQLKIKLDDGRCLTVVSEENCALRFYIETELSALRYTMK